MDDAYSDELLAQLRRRSTFGAFISRHDFQLRSSSSGGDSLDRSETLPSKQLRDEVGNSAPHFFSEFPEYAPSVQAILETEMPAVQKISKIAAEILRTDGSPVPTMDIPGKASIEEEDMFNDPKRAAETPEIAEEDVEAEYMDEPEEPDAEGLDTFIADDSPEDLEGVPKELKTDETGSKVEDLESTKLKEKDPCDCPGLVPKEPETSDPETPVVQEEFEEKTEAEATEDWANSGIEIPDKAIVELTSDLESTPEREIVSGLDSISNLEPTPEEETARNQNPVRLSELAQYQESTPDQETTSYSKFTSKQESTLNQVFTLIEELTSIQESVTNQEPGSSHGSVKKDQPNIDLESALDQRRIPDYDPTSAPDPGSYSESTLDQTSAIYDKLALDESYELVAQPEHTSESARSDIAASHEALVQIMRTPDRRPTPIRTSSSDRRPTPNRTPHSARTPNSARSLNSERRPTPDRRRTIDTPPRPPVTPKAWVSRASFAGETISSMLKKRDSNASLRSPSSASVRSSASTLSRAPSSASIRSFMDSPSRIPSRASSRASFTSVPTTPQLPSRIPSRTPSQASLRSSANANVHPGIHSRTPSSVSMDTYSRSPSITSLISPTVFAEAPSRTPSRIPVLTPALPLMTRSATTPTTTPARPRLPTPTKSSRTSAKTEK